MPDKIILIWFESDLKSFSEETKKHWATPLTHVETLENNFLLPRLFFIFLVNLDHLSSRYVLSGCSSVILPDLNLAFNTRLPNASSTSPLSPNLH